MTAVVAHSASKMPSLVEGFMKRAMDGDLGDVPGTFKLRAVEGGERYEPTGPSGFWVALDGDEVIGEVGLSEFFFKLRLVIRSVEI